MALRLVVYLKPSTITFTRPIDGGAYPLLNSVSTLRLAARAGQQSGLGVGESPSINVSLDNVDKRAATLLGNPLRARAELYNSDNSLFWAGFVSHLTNTSGASTLTIES